jgi:hypothetical protein
MAHSTITRYLRAADGTLHRLNLLMLLLASFVPFPTKLVSEFIEEEGAERVAVVFYGLALLALGMSLTSLLRYAFGQRDLLKDHVDEKTAAAGRRYRPSYLLYLWRWESASSSRSSRSRFTSASRSTSPCRSARSTGSRGASRSLRLDRAGWRPVPQRDRDRRPDHDRRNDFRHDQDDARGGDTVREPE